MNPIGVLGAVLVGRAVPYTRPGSFSAIDKRAVLGRVHANHEGLDGDEQGDRMVHGGPDKAVLLYAYHHYPTWRGKFGDQALLHAPGAFGENLSVLGFDETTACIGDKLSSGSALFEVSHPREPCWKLAERFGVPDMVARVNACGRSGWYCRVREEGDVGAGDVIKLIERPFQDWPIARMQALRANAAPDSAELRAALRLPLPRNWLHRIEKRLGAA